MASSFFEDPGVQIRRLHTENRRLHTENCRLQTENDRLQSENRRLRTDNGPLEKEEEGNDRRLHFDQNAIVIEMEKEARKDVETFWRKDEGAAVPKKDDDDDAADERLRAENRRLRVQNVLLNRQKEAEKEAEAFLSQLQIENAFLKKEKEEKEAEKADGIKDHEEMCETLEMAMVQCESLRQELDRKNSQLDEKFAQLAEARIARDKELEKVEGFMACNKYLEEKLERHERSVQVVCGRARRMLERVKGLVEDEAGKAKAPENEEEADEKWIRVLMQPLEEEMEKIESSFNKKRSVRLILVSSMIFNKN